MVILHEIKKYKAICLIILIGVIIYANSCTVPFIWDDIPLIVENPYIKNLNNIPKVFASSLFYSDYRKSNYYRPLQTLTYIFDYAVWKLKAAGYHISNILFHLLCAILVYLFILTISANKTLSLIASLLFAVNPIHTEAVTYIAGRADSLAVAFFLLSLILYIRSKGLSKAKSYYPLSIVFFILALLSKEICIALPFMLILYDSYFSANKEQNLKQKLRLYLPYFTVLALYAVLRMTVLNFSQKPVLILRSGFFPKLTRSIEAVIIYIGMALWPLNLHMERKLQLPESMWLSTVLIILVAAIIVFSVKSRKKQKLLSFGAAWFLLNLIPVSGIFMPKKYIIMAEHWLYLPSIGLFIILGLLFNKLIERNKFVGIISIMSLLTFYSYLTIRQNATWAEPGNFYKRTIVYSPDSSKAHFNLGLIYEQQKDYDKALQEYKTTQELEPDYFLVHNSIGNVYFQKGLYDEAIAEYRQCLNAKPDYFLAYNNLGNIYALKGNYGAAVREYKRSIELNANYSESHNNLGLVYLENENYPEAEKEFIRALELNPENPEAHNNLGNLYSKRGLHDEAVTQYKKALKLNHDFDKAHFNLGVAYYRKGLTGQAEEEWKKVLQISPDHAGALIALGALANPEKTQ